ncbi:MAG: ATP-binding cassette domain-containing protein [Bacillota bacterium]|nr:ATP-binding cassette domain-containing protein [Bacillota bacterium]
MTNKAEKKKLITIDRLKMYFPLKKQWGKEQLYVRANDDISIDIYEGETLGLVGESGCGKSTLGKTLLQITTPTEGRTIYYGRSIDEIAPKYVTEILKNLPKLRRDCLELEQKAKEAHAQAEKAPKDSEEEYKLINRAKEADKEYRRVYYDIVQLIGGLFLAEDLQPIADIFLKEHEVAVRLRKANIAVTKEHAKLDAQIAKLEEKGASKAEINSATQSKKAVFDEKAKAVAELEKELKQVQSEIEAMQKPYRSNPEFDRHEKYRDKGVDLARLRTNEMKLIRKDMQLIFQDPYSSLDPKMTVGQIVSEGLYTHNMFSPKDPKVQDYIIETMEKCGLQKYFVHRYPHQFSGGQRQRIGIARSVALNPKFIVCDEAVSALDVSIQSQVINLLLDLKEQNNLTYLFISHDLSVIKYISDRVGVMYLGNMVEISPTQELYDRPMHPYTEALLNAIPTTDTETGLNEKVILEGDIPSPIRPPSGCKFHTRCRYVTDICRNVVPVLEEVTPGHFVACHHKLNQDQ